ncbi:histone H1-delta-like [Artemia franciscana]|uniref:histone H1-delta-like n=1 Tax=Artemia franciscana TaxID=6661 RepID=UPI0032D9DB3F
MSEVEAEVAPTTVESQSMASPAKKEKKAKAPKPAKVAKPKGDKKAKAPANHPKYTEMITKSIADLKERGGSSRQAILKYIMANFQVGNDAKIVNMHLKQALKRCLANGIVINPKGTGVTGSFKLAKPIKAESPKAGKPAKPTAKKTSVKKTAKPTAVKKSTSAKKATKPTAGSKKSVKAFKKPTVAKKAVAPKKLTPKKGSSVKKAPAAKKVVSKKSVAKKSAKK